MTKIDIFSGFLGAGKTTLIKKLIKEAYQGEKLVLIENEFGQIGIDGGFLKEAGIQINELNSGCICCSLVGDFGKALREVESTYHPDRILIEPSGVGKLSDVIRAVREAELSDAKLNSFTTVVDAGKCKMYMKNFGEFFNDQVENASAIVFSHVKGVNEEKISAAIELVREKNSDATLITTDWDLLTGAQILAAIERANSLDCLVSELKKEAHEHHHHHHGECDDPDCECHEHHHADEVFTSFGAETRTKYTAEEIEAILHSFAKEDDYGTILRAKGIVEAADGRWLHFDYIPGEPDVRYGSAEVIGRICVIGSNLDKEKIAVLFRA